MVVFEEKKLQSEDASLSILSLPHQITTKKTSLALAFASVNIVSCLLLPALVDFLSCRLLVAQISSWHNLFLGR